MTGQAKTFVENIDDVDIIWDRLNEKYGDKIDLIDKVIKDLEKIQTMRNNDD